MVHMVELVFSFVATSYYALSTCLEAVAIKIQVGKLYTVCSV